MRVILSVLEGEDGQLSDEKIGYRNTCMKELLIEGKGLNKEGGKESIGKDGGSSAMSIPLANISGENEASKTIDR